MLDTLVTPMVWSQLPDAPVARHHVQLAAIGTTLYLLAASTATPDGMNDYPARGDSYALDTAAMTPAWRSIAAMPAGFERGSAAVVVAPPRIYLFGGAATTDAVASNHLLRRVDRYVVPGPRLRHGAQLPDLPRSARIPRRCGGSTARSSSSADSRASRRIPRRADVYVLPTAQQNPSGMWMAGDTDAGASAVAARTARSRAS